MANKRKALVDLPTWRVVLTLISAAVGWLVCAGMSVYCWVLIFHEVDAKRDSDAHLITLIASALFFWFYKDKVWDGILGESALK